MPKEENKIIELMSHKSSTSSKSYDEEIEFPSKRKLKPPIKCIVCARNICNRQFRLQFFWFDVSVSRATFYAPFCHLTHNEKQQLYYLSDNNSPGEAGIIILSQYGQEIPYILFRSQTSTPSHLIRPEAFFPFPVTSKNQNRPLKKYNLSITNG